MILLILCVCCVCAVAKWVTLYYETHVKFAREHKYKKRILLLNPAENGRFGNIKNSVTLYGHSFQAKTSPAFTMH